MSVLIQIQQDLAGWPNFAVSRGRFNPIQCPFKQNKMKGLQMSRLDLQSHMGRLYTASNETCDQKYSTMGVTAGENMKQFAHWLLAYITTTSRFKTLVSSEIKNCPTLSAL